LAHSVEAWREGTLAGGLYGVSLGKCFFGESMFTKVPNASKAAFITLVKTLARYDFQLIDCQVYTDHLYSLGAEMVGREDFLHLLRKALDYETLRGNWHFLSGGTIKWCPLGSSILAGGRRRGCSPYFVHHNKSLSS